MKVSSGIYQSVLGYADSITAASSAQSEMTGAPNKRQTSAKRPPIPARRLLPRHIPHMKGFLLSILFRTALFEQLFSNGLLSSARPFERPFTRPSFKRPPSSNPSRALLLRTPSFERPSFNCSRLQHALLRKICKNIQESTPSYPRTIFPQVNDKGISRQPTRP